MTDRETYNSVDQSGEWANSSTPSISAGEILIGTLAGLSSNGQALVQFPENPTTEPVEAITTVEIHPKFIGRQLALAFASGNIHKPIIMGFIQSPLHALLDSQLSQQNVAEPAPNLIEDLAEDGNTSANFELENIQAEPTELFQQNVSVDGKRIVIEGQHEIVLKCGEASITLTRAGKILIRGKYLSNRSSGVNRIMGGSVQVN